MVLLFQEGVGLKITQSKIALTVHSVLCGFPRKGKGYKSPSQN